MRLEIQRKSKVIVSFTREQHIDAACLKTRMHTLQKCVRIIPSKDTEKLPRMARGAFFVPFDRKNVRKERTEKKGNI